MMNLKNVFRISEWKNSHLLLLLTGFTIFSLINSIEFNLFIKNISYLFITALFVGCYGYYLNDVFDIEADTKAGKKNFASKHSLTQRFVVICLLLLATFIVWYLLNKNLFIFYLLIFEILLLFFYAVPKIRIKERVYLSVIFDALYAYVIWGIIILELTIRNIEIISFIYLSWLFLFGIRGILTHHITDYYNDLQSNTKTTVIRFGVNKVQVFQKFIIPPVELILFLILLCLINRIYIYSYVAYLLISFNNGEIFPKYDRIRYLKTETNLLAKFSENFYFGWLPLITLLQLVFTDFRYGIILVFFILLFFNQFKKVLLSLTPQYYFVFGILSFIVNHSLYYFFLIFRIDLKERAEAKLVKVDSIEMLRTDENELINNVGLVLDKIIEKKVNSLWIGKKLSNMELLTIRSFIENGYEFYLWTYGKLENELSDSLIICDANEIIPYNEVFVYKSKSQFGYGLGSVAGFSDIFRYKLLYEKGGWWVDMDVTCLKSFDVVSDYFFRHHHELGVVGNIMKVPKNSLLMKKCYEQAKSTIDENNSDWHKPIQLLVNNINLLKLNEFVFKGVSNTDEFKKIEKYYFENSEFPEEWRFIHWCNEVLRSYSLSKEHSFFYSSYSQLLLKYKLLETPINLQEFDNDFKKKLLFANLNMML